MKDNNSVVKAVFYALAVSLLMQSKCGESVWIADKWCLPVSIFLFYSSYLLDEIYHRQTGVWYEVAECLAWMSFILSGWIGLHASMSLVVLCLGIGLITSGLIGKLYKSKVRDGWKVLWVCENVLLIGAIVAFLLRHTVGKLLLEVPVAMPWKGVLAVGITWCPFGVSMLILIEKIVHFLRKSGFNTGDANPDVKRVVDATCMTFYLTLEELRKSAAQRVVDSLLTELDDSTKKLSAK